MEEANTSDWPPRNLYHTDSGKIPSRQPRGVLDVRLFCRCSEWTGCCWCAGHTPFPDSCSPAPVLWAGAAKCSRLPPSPQNCPQLKGSHPTQEITPISRGNPQPMANWHRAVKAWLPYHKMRPTLRFSLCCRAPCGVLLKLDASWAPAFA